ncbi:MAG: efflux RND transporter periplasmic adaptor subunit [Dokdonella sp.]
MTRHGLWIASLAGMLAGCGSGDDTSAPPDPVAQVSVATVTRAPMRRELTAYGSVEYAPDATRTIAASSDVIVDKVLVRAGDAVTDGQPLMRVRGTPAALLELEKSRTDLSVANQALARTQRLFDQHLSTNADMAAARQNLANSRAATNSAVARVGANGVTTLQANADGNVLSVDAASGDTIAAGAALLHLASGNQLYVRVGVEPADVALLRPGQPARLLSSFDGSTAVPGTVSSVSPRIDPRLRLAQALIATASDAALLPNADMRAEITVEQRDAVLGVPRAAVLHDGDQDIVFTVNSDKATRVAVKTGLDDGQRVEIVSGLSAGDRVVIQGNHELQDGMAVRVGKDSAAAAGPKSKNSAGSSGPSADAGAAGKSRQ